MIKNCFRRTEVQFLLWAFVIIKATLVHGEYEGTYRQCSFSEVNFCLDICSRIW